MAGVTPPEQGQIVEVRNRRYAVAEVAKSTRPHSSLDPALLSTQHLVSLTSVEDDALGEDLQVIWELEPGARVYDQRALPTPTGFDTPQRLDAFLNAVRWGAASSADVRALQAPFRSGISIEDYQLDPVVRALQMPRVNLLIADDVGLGKTIEAGLVIQELIIRHRARKILIVCPAALQIQWRDQMREKFGLEFRIVDADLMRALRRARGIHVNPWGHFPRLITSVDYLKRDQPMRLFRETLPASGQMAYPRSYDMLIVDEAHNVAPSGVGAYAVDSLRTAAIRTLAPHFEHKLFLTATPHNGYAESFSALLELLDNQRFARSVPPDRAVLQHVMVRRLKSELKEAWTNRPRFPARELRALEVDHSDAERQAHRDLHAYTLLRRAGAADNVERTATEFVLKLLKKRLLSSPAAFFTTLQKHRASLDAATRSVGPKARRPSGGILKAMLADLDDAYADDDAYEAATGEAVATTSALFRAPSPEERVLLDRMLAWATDARLRPDRKARTLLDWVTQVVRPNGVWSAERVIIFSEYRDTQTWLQGLLAAERLTEGGRLMLLYGGMHDDDRERVKAAFQASPQTSAVRILLATDAASEGIDLQRHCHRLVHYEIPWNPNRMEQRNGRIDRHGQLHNPQVFHFAPAGFSHAAIDRDAPVGELEGDLEFLMRAVQKVEQIREDLGKVGPVIADQVTEAMLGTRRRLETAGAERAAAPSKRMLTFDRNLGQQIKDLADQLQESRASLQLSPENVQSVVTIALQLAGQPLLIEAKAPGIWPDPSGERRRCPVFALPALTGSWATCAEGLEHPHTRAVRPIVFDHDLAKGRDDLVLAHLNHRLVQMALRLLRAEVWSAEGHRKLHRVTARVVPSVLTVGAERWVLHAPLAIAYGRLVVIGGDSQRLHEELIAAGVDLADGRARRLTIGQVQAALAAVTAREPSAALKETLAARWAQASGPTLSALEARAKDRAASLSRLLEERRVQESDDIARILAELTTAIRAELTVAEKPEQLHLDLFNEAERDQYRRDVDALRLRLRQIPGELAQEQAGILRRYADPQPRLFPVAVTFLVPERMLS
ncbi:DEAD/DEAH box helicase [Chloroflexales bacterium ZM16-3]|nr:DEAD/DEAH box helicase [Chloroflexales bacterium ZM16-3]